MSFIADIVSSVFDAGSSLIGGAVNAVEQIPVVGDVVKGGMNVMNSLGPIGTLAASFALPGIGSALGLGSIAGAEGAAMTAEEIQAAMDAGGYTVDQIAAATGNSVSAVTDVLSGAGGGLPLQVADQASFAASSAAGGIGGGSIGQLGQLAKVGSQLYAGINGLTSPGQTPQAAQANADPYAQYRPQAASQLNQLVANPSSLTSTPGYQTQLQQAQQQGLGGVAGQRAAAAGGFGQSGQQVMNQALIGQGFFNQQYNQQYNQLAQLSGANQAPSVGQVAYGNAATQQAQAQTSAYQNLASAFGGLASPQMQSFWS